MLHRFSFCRLDSVGLSAPRGATVAPRRRSTADAKGFPATWSHRDDVLSDFESKWILSLLSERLRIFLSSLRSDDALMHLFGFTVSLPSTVQGGYNTTPGSDTLISADHFLPDVDTGDGGSI